MNATDKRLTSVNQWIRGGDSARAKRELRKIVAKRVPRADLAYFGWLSWRAGAPALGLRAIGKVLRPGRKSPVTVTPAEAAEYVRRFLHCNPSESSCAARILCWWGEAAAEPPTFSPSFENCYWRLGSSLAPPASVAALPGSARLCRAEFFAGNQ